MKRWRQVVIGSLLISASLILVLLLSPPLRSQIQVISGLAVAQSSIKWNNLKDAAVGDNQTSGLAAVGMFYYDGTNFDLLRGTGGAINTTISGTIGVSTATSSSLSTNQVAVDATGGGTLIKAANSSRKSIIIRNQGSTDMYVGVSGVTALTGLLLKATEVLTLDRNTAAIYGITSAGSTTVGYLEE
jgi:hypothetical protein